MNYSEFEKLVRQGESETVEFKRTTGQRTEAAKTLCAMLNGKGGYVLFGISDRGEILGQQVSSRTLEDIAGEVNRISPPVFPVLVRFDLDGNRTVFVLRDHLPVAGEVLVRFRPALAARTRLVSPSDQVMIRILEFCRVERSLADIISRSGFRHKASFRKNHFNLPLEKSLLRMTLPDKPRSRLQRYIITHAGEELLLSSSSKQK